MIGGTIATLFILAILGATTYVFSLPFILHGASKKKEIEQKLQALPAFAPAIRFKENSTNTTLALDPSSEQWAVVGLEGPARLYGFNQLVAVEIERDGASLEKTNRGSQLAGAAVGAAFLGPVGLLIGGLSGSKRQEPTVKRLALKLYTNNLQSPVSKITFFDHPSGLKVGDQQVVQAVSELEKWHARFLTVLQGQSGDASPPSPSAHTVGRRRGLVAQQ